MSVSSIHKFSCGCECIEYLDMNGETLPDMERCKEHYTTWDGQVEVLKKEVERLTAEVEFRKEQIAELFDKRDDVAKTARLAERSVWCTFILNSSIVREEWERRRGDRWEFSADDAGQLIESVLRTRAHDLQAARLEGALAVLADAGVSQYIPFRMEGELANRIASSIVKHLEDGK